MGLMDIINGFRGVTDNNAASNSQQSAAGNPSVPSTATPGSDGSVAAIPATSTGDKSPLDGYADLWKLDTSKTPTSSPTMTPNMTVDPSKIMEVARQMDFTKGLDAEMLQKASKGDAEALVGLINSASQNAYAQGAVATTRIVQNAFTLQEKNFNESVMPSILRKHSISQAVADNPISNNPAAAPLLAALESQLTTKYPTASPAEIKKHAETYLGGFAEEIVRSNGGTILPKDNASNSNQLGTRGSTSEDWEKFFDVAS